MKFRLFANLKIKSLNNLLSMPQLLNTVSLVPDFTNGLLPMNIIKYVSEKGCVFLNYLQDILGGPEKFHPFLVFCIENRRILTSDRFKTSLYEYFSHKHKILNIAVNWDKWFNEPRFPASHPYIMDRRKTFWQGQADLWIAQRIPSFDTIGLDQSNDLAIIEFLTYLLTLSTVLAAYQLRKIEHEFLRDQNICEI
ncbi:leukotriene A-4 hydrolase-like, partial [Temnothorax curvispinosus]|uniref:Leukotriene A-4 hydrolase-like n=1 Tax=Temnothorax curvispinosus TaxID=300111 RepID=A0A6J1PFD9_9HYME